MIGPVLVTGATGALGRAIVAALTEAGIAVLQGVRSPEKARPGVDSVRFDYTDPATFGAALSGAGGILLMAPPLDGDAAAKLEPVIEQAKAAGVGQIVLISAFGVNHNEQAPLRVVEHLLMASGVPYTILRPNFFMENFSEGSMAGSIREQAAIFVAAGDGKTSFISVRDIAAAVAAAFRDSLTGREIDLTGPEALDHAEIAQIIGDVTGRAVAYHALTAEQMSEALLGMGMPAGPVAYLGMLYGVVRAGYAAGVTDGAESVTGRKPIAFRQFAEGVAWAWK